MGSPVGTRLRPGIRIEPAVVIDDATRLGMEISAMSLENQTRILRALAWSHRDEPHVKCRLAAALLEGHKV